MLPLQFMFRLNPHQYIEEFLKVGIELVCTAKSKPILAAYQIIEEIEDDYPMTITSITQILKSKKYRLVITYISKISLLFAIFICIPGYVWYIAVNLTTMPKLTAIYSTTCFWAYVFSIILLNESVKMEKIMAVIISIAGVVIMTFFTTKDDENSILNYENYEYSSIRFFTVEFYLAFRLLFIFHSLQ